MNVVLDVSVCTACAASAERRTGKHLLFTYNPPKSGPHMDAAYYLHTLDRYAQGWTCTVILLDYIIILLNLLLSLSELVNLHRPQFIPTSYHANAAVFTFDRFAINCTSLGLTVGQLRRTFHI